MTAAEDKFQSEKDEDVEAHKRQSATDEAKENDEDGDDDDVEAHRRRA